MPPVIMMGGIFFINNAFIQIFCNICDSIKFKCDNPFRENAVTLSPAFQGGAASRHPGICRAAKKQRNAFYALFRCLLWG